MPSLVRRTRVKRDRVGVDVGQPVGEELDRRPQVAVVRAIVRTRRGPRPSPARPSSDAAASARATSITAESRVILPLNCSEEMKRTPLSASGRGRVRRRGPASDASACQRSSDFACACRPYRRPTTARTGSARRTSPAGWWSISTAIASCTAARASGRKCRCRPARPWRRGPRCSGRRPPSPARRRPSACPPAPDPSAPSPGSAA